MLAEWKGELIDCSEKIKLRLRTTKMIFFFLKESTHHAVGAYGANGEPSVCVRLCFFTFLSLPPTGFKAG